MNHSSDNQGVIRRAAELARQRLGKLVFCRWLAASHFWLAVTGAIGIASWRWFGGLDSTPVAVAAALALIAVWLLVGWLASLIKRPDELTALSVIDERGDWKDTFSSALAFEKKLMLEEGERLHVQRARAAAADALEDIDRVLPATSLRAAWIAPLLLLAFSFSPLLIRPGEVGDAELTEEMRQAAQREAERLAKEAENIERIADLAEEEKEEIERLREAVDGVSDELADAEGKSAREVLEALEERARAAERLAEKLGAADTGWASEEMLREMAQHADTADLAIAIRDKNARISAEESDRLESVLASDDLPGEGQQRITEALARTMQKATEEDQKKPVGEHVGNASRKMSSQQPRPAARDFGRLADHFRGIEQREKAQEELKKLADKLRESGSKISGAEMEPMKQLTGAQGGKGGENPPGKVQPLGAQQPLAQTPQGQTPGTLGAQMPQPQTLQVPGMQNAQPQSPGQQGKGQQGAAPVPGSKGNSPQSGQKGQPGMAAAGQKGGKGKKGQAMALSAPIPGMDPGQAPGASSLGAASQGPGNLSSNGGLEAGNATAELGESESAPIKAGDQVTVQAQINDDGESTLRAVEGQARSEQAQVERRAAAVEFIEVEEDALDEKALPLSRRNHVLRYFTEIRERFENENSAGGQP